MHGIRYKTSKYMLGALDTKGNYKPNFLDYQTQMTWKVGKQREWDITVLGNISQNSYVFEPDSSETSSGTMENPINGINFSKQCELILDTYKNKKIIAIDASCGSADELGFVCLKNKPIRVGRGLNKKIGSVGKYSLTGCVVLKQETQELTFDMLISEDNSLVEILVNSIVGILFIVTCYHKYLISINYSCLVKRANN